MCGYVLQELLEVLETLKSDINQLKTEHEYVNNSYNYAQFY